MASLTRSEMNLLEKLYNLRGEDSTILKNIEQDAESVDKQKTQKEEESKAVEEKIEALTKTIQDLKDTSDSFVARFSDCKRSDYETLLTVIDLPFDPEAAVLYVQEKTPPKIEELQRDKETKEEESAKLIDEIEEAKLKLAELDRDKETAGKNRDNLNKLLSEILEGNLNITVQELTDLLKELKFSEAECNEIGKLLFFSDALVKYDDMLKTGKSTAEQKVATEEPKHTPTEEATVVQEEAKSEDSGATLDELHKLLESAKEENASKETAPNVEEEQTTPATQEAADEGIDAQKILEQLKLATEPNADLLADSEFSKKYLFLKTYAADEDIALNLQVIRGNSYQNLVQKETKLSEAGISPALLPLSIFEDNNAENYVTNVKNLNAKGFALDENELAKQVAALYTDSTIFAKNLDLVVSYNLLFKKANGKLPLEILAQNTEELVQAMDAVIDNSEEAILNNSPEFIGKCVDDILGRIATLRTNSISYRSNDGKYKALLGDPIAYNNALGGTMDASVPLVSKEQNNTTLATFITTKEIMDVLNAGTMQYVDATMGSSYQTMLDKLASLSDVSDYSYKIAGVHFSKKRFERNLVALTQGLAKQGINANMDEVIFAALVFDSNKKAEEMKMVAETLGFSLATGGMER